MEYKFGNCLIRWKISKSINHIFYFPKKLPMHTKITHNRQMNKVMALGEIWELPKNTKKLIYD